MKLRYKMSDLLLTLNIFIILFSICACNNKEQNKTVTPVTETEKNNKPTIPKDSIEVKGIATINQNTKNFHFYISDKNEKNILNEFKTPFLDFTADYKNPNKDRYKIIIEMSININDDVKFGISSYEDLKAGKEVILERYDLKDKNIVGTFELNKDEKLYNHILKVCEMIVEKTK